MSPRDLFGEIPAQAPRRRQRRAPAVSSAAHTWFFALRPDAVEAALIDAFAERLMASHGVSGKPIGPGRLHITLHCIGHDIDEATVAAACRAADTVRLSAIDVRFDTAMSFKGSSGPFVLRGGAGLEGVHRLHTVLGCALADQGFKLAPSYTPHMTLCYDPQRHVASFAIEPIGFRASEFVLIKSHVGFSRHALMRRWELAGCTEQEA